MSGRELEKLRAGLRELAREADRHQPPPNREGLLCSEFRLYHRRRSIRQGILIAGIAACLTIVFAGGTVMIRRSSAPEPVVQTRPPAEAPVAHTPAPRREMSVEATSPVRRRSTPAKARRLPVPQPPIEEQVMTGFLPVGVGVTFGPGDRGSLVRVRLPRSALASFGLPVNEDRDTKTVNADVLLGDDGLARAIRFIQ